MNQTINVNNDSTNPTNNTNPTNLSTDEKVNAMPVSKMPIENEVNSLQNETHNNLLIQPSTDTDLSSNNGKLINDNEVKPTNLEDKLTDLEAALQAFTPLDDALAAFGITNEEFNCYLDTLGTDAESYLKQQYGLGLVSFRSNLAVLAATKPTAAKLLYDDLVNRGLVGNRDTSNNNIVIKFEGDD